MSILLTLKIIAIKKKDKKLLNTIKVLERYIDRRRCVISAEVYDGGVLIYDTTHNQYVLRIEITEEGGTVHDLSR
jgi:predicted thioesterase